MATETLVKISQDVPREHVDEMVRFLERTGASDSIPPPYAAADGYSDLLCSSLRADRVQRGKVSCLLSVGPPLLNAYGGLHGGAVAAVAERVAIGCARTVMHKDKELFLGELSISYLSAAPQNSELIIDASVVRTGRNVTVVEVNFKSKKSEKLAFAARATFFNMPLAKL
ncbi:uncharacterized protein LOC115743227 [Rhodamnia argentea]|uniref:Uncharacterized protein LOC115743227 n=1 Tax=Rhodamnia argentea TaxID=178133 RepID=A0A8B8PH75_9MYRT|nr:uncharacterized protein LOC115743227 [Rhodamnia argentea]